MVHKRYITQRWLNEFADAFYDENYKKLSMMLGRKITSQSQAESELEAFKIRNRGW